jgi:hypothetical protein
MIRKVVMVQPTKGRYIADTSMKWQFSMISICYVAFLDAGLEMPRQEGRDELMGSRKQCCNEIEIKILFRPLRSLFLPICSLISECSAAKVPGILLFLFRVNGFFPSVAPSFGLFFPLNTSLQVTRMTRKRHGVACLSLETRVSVCDQLSNYLRKFTHIQVSLHHLAISIQCNTGRRQASPKSVDPLLEIRSTCRAGQKWTAADYPDLPLGRFPRSSVKQDLPLPALSAMLLPIRG